MNTLSQMTQSMDKLSVIQCIKYINCIITRSSVQILAQVMEFSLSHAKNKSITKLNANVHVYHGLVCMTIRASISLNIFVCNDTNLWFFSVF